MPHGVLIELPMIDTFSPIDILITSPMTKKTNPTSSASASIR